MPVIIRVEAWDVDHRLAELGLSRDQLIEAVRACAAARGGCTDNDPPNAKGIEVWRWGVRRLRELLRPEGLEKDDTGGFSTIVNRPLRYRIAVVNTDDATGILGENIPQNRSRKGTASERAAATNHQQLLPGAESWPHKAADGREPVSEFSTWHLCVYIEGDTVRAELSLLVGFESGYFTDCHERIILLGHGDWEKLDFGDGANDSGPEFEVEVRRK
jgi:hypothetical protein